jgi:SAM-dependent methyltransferase
MTLQRLAYFLFGNNIVVGSHIRKQLDYLRQIVPDNFKHRQTHDLGCGDGKITVRLKDIFQPTEFKGYDVCPELVKRTLNKGIDAEVKDLSKDLPDGDMAIMWGVLHHLDDMEGCLANVKNNYRHIFIREPINTGNTNLFELGHPMREPDLGELVARTLPGSQVFSYHNAMFIFYENNNGHVNNLNSGF